MQSLPLNQTPQGLWSNGMFQNYVFELWFSFMSALYQAQLSLHVAYLMLMSIVIIYFRFRTCEVRCRKGRNCQKLRIPLGLVCKSRWKRVWSNDGWWSVTVYIFIIFFFGEGGGGGGGVGQCMQGELNTVRSIKCMARIHRLSYHIVSFSHFSFFSRELSAMESRETFR